MFRYRCPKCSVVLQSPELRAGKTTVCSNCSQPLTIPADRRMWLNEKGEPLIASPTMVIASASGTTPPPLLRVPAAEIERHSDSAAEFEFPAEADNDVLGAIAHGEIVLPDGPQAMDLDAIEPLASPEPEAAKPVWKAEAPPVPAPSFSRSLPEPDPDDGKVELYPPTPAAETPRPPQTPPPRTPAPIAPQPRFPSPPRVVPPRPIPVAAHRPEPKPSVATPPPAWVGASSRSGARSQRVVRVESAEENRGGSVAVEEPLRLRTGMDIAVDLTSALATRMKPPPKPPRDLRLSTAVWILTTGLGVALLVASLISTNNFVPLVFAIGAAQALAGYAWVTALAFRRDPQRGLACAIPPFTLWYLTNWKYAMYRPLRFVLSGAALIGLALLAPRVQSQTRSWAGASDAHQPVVAPPEIASQSKLVQLRHYRDQRQYDPLIALLRKLAHTDSMYSEDAKNRVDLVAELKLLGIHKDSGVRIESLAAYATWGGADARERCLEASRSQNGEERLMALRLLPRWKDEDVARRIAELIGRAGTETSAAQDAMITLGGPIAERATIPLLRKDDQGIRLTAIEILGNEKVGGAEAIAALKEVARTSPDPGTRQPAEAKALRIKERLRL